MSSRSKLSAFAAGVCTVLVSGCETTSPEGRDPVPELRADETLRIGSVDVQMQWVDDGDLEMAVVFDQGPEEESATATSGGASTRVTRPSW